jgi:hypothetical protein
MVVINHRNIPWGSRCAHPVVLLLPFSPLWVPLNHFNSQGVVLLVISKGASCDPFNHMHDVRCIATTFERALRYALDLLPNKVKDIEIKSIGTWSPLKSSELVLWTTKYIMIYPNSGPSLEVIALRPAIWYWRWTCVTKGWAESLRSSCGEGGHGSHTPYLKGRGSFIG